MPADMRIVLCHSSWRHQSLRKKRIGDLQVPSGLDSSAVLDGLEVAFGLDGGVVGRYQSGAAPSLSSWGLLPAAIGCHTILRASRKLNLP
jgi:hypothetical protein